MRERKERKNNIVIRGIKWQGGGDRRVGKVKANNGKEEEFKKGSIYWRRCGKGRPHGRGKGNSEETQGKGKRSQGKGKKARVGYRKI